MATGPWLLPANDSDEVTCESFSLSAGNDEYISYECDACKFQNITSEATAYCTSCPSYLCKRCEQAHRGIRATTNHKILTGADFPPDASKPNPTLPLLHCEDHKTMTISSFCESHGTVICRTCKLTNHTCCVTTTVSEQTKQVKIDEGVNDTMRYLAELKTKYVKLETSRQRDKKIIISQLQESLQDMQKVRKEISDNFDKLEKKLNLEIKQHEERLKKEVDDHLVITNDALDQITDAIKSLLECQKTKDDDVMFVAMNKAVSLKSKYDHTMSNLQKDIQRVQIRFQANDVITDVVKQMQSIGQIVIDKEPAYPNHVTITPVKKTRKAQTTRRRVVVDNTPTLSSVRQAPKSSSALVFKREVSVESLHVLGCTFMPSGYLVLGCGTDGLKLLDKDFNITSRRSDFSLRLSAINDTEVMVTQGHEKQLLRVKVYPRMTVEKRIKVERVCTGVDVFGGEIFVTCHDNPGNGEILVLNMDGVIQRKLGYVRLSLFSRSSSIFTKPNCVKVNRSGNRIYVSDEDAGTVTCMDQQGTVLYTFSDINLKTPTGMYVGSDDTVLVCGHGSGNVLKVRYDGKMDKLVLNRNDNITYPMCISYRDQDSCLVVGFGIEDSKQSLTSFFMEKI